jgi:hypothetical protein
LHSLESECELVDGALVVGGSLIIHTPGAAGVL